MRHAAASLLALSLLCWGCGQTSAEGGEFSEVVVETYTPALPAAAPSKPDPAAEQEAPRTQPPAPLPAQAEAAAVAGIRLLWEEPRRFHEHLLLATRRLEAPYRLFEPAVIANVVRPAGALKGIRSIPSSMFELSEGFLTTRVHPTEQLAEAESEEYGGDLQRVFLLLEAEAGEILAAVFLVPGQGEEGWRVQSLSLKSRSLGGPMDSTDPRAERAVKEFLEAIRAGEGVRLHASKVTPGLQRDLPLARFEQAAAELRGDLPVGDAPLALERSQARRWFSGEGWTQTYEVRLQGRARPVLVNINLLEGSYLVSGISWGLEGP